MENHSKVGKDVVDGLAFSQQAQRMTLARPSACREAHHDRVGPIVVAGEHARALAHDPIVPFEGGKHVVEIAALIERPRLLPPLATDDSEVLTNEECLMRGMSSASG